MNGPQNGGHAMCICSECIANRERLGGRWFSNSVSYSKNIRPGQLDRSFSTSPTSVHNFLKCRSGLIWGVRGRVSLFQRRVNCARRPWLNFERCSEGVTAHQQKACAEIPSIDSTVHCSGCHHHTKGFQGRRQLLIPPAPRPYFFFQQVACPQSPDVVDLGLGFSARGPICQRDRPASPLFVQVRFPIVGKDWCEIKSIMAHRPDSCLYLSINILEERNA